MRRRLQIALLLVALALFAAPAGQAQARELTVVQANIGNVNVPACNDQVFKLCLRKVEDRGAKALRAISPDVVAFQEILPPDRCRTAPSSNPNNLCSGLPEPPLQALRLLGPGYDVACDSRFAWECLAVKRVLLRIEEFATRPVLPGCEDTGFTLNSGTLRVAGWPVSITDAHPDSMDRGCRAAQVRDLLGAALPAAGPALVMGDWNLDPFREDDESVAAWKEFVPGRFAYASTDELTFFPFAPSQTDTTGEVLDGDGTLPQGRRTIDIVVQRGLGGSCRVQRIDGGGGMDHRAQVCRIEVGEEVTPRLRFRRRGCTVTARFEPAPPHLRAVRFRVGARTVVDRRAPFQLRQRGAARTSRPRFTATAILENGDGPERRRRLQRCGRR